MFNSTGVEVGGVRRSRAKTYGQVRFPLTELQRLLVTGELHGSNWHATPLQEYGEIRKVHLMKRAGRRQEVELHLVTVSDELVGWLDCQSWSGAPAQLVSWSEFGKRQELMFLMKPFAYLRGATGVAVLNVGNGRANWTITRW